jgi:hypothetical protein
VSAGARRLPPLGAAAYWLVLRRAFCVLLAVAINRPAERLLALVLAKNE